MTGEAIAWSLLVTCAILLLGGLHAIALIVEWVAYKLTKDVKKRLKYEAKRRLCYGLIAQLEYAIYNEVWTHPVTRQVGSQPYRPATPRNYELGQYVRPCGHKCASHGDPY